MERKRRREGRGEKMERKRRREGRRVEEKEEVGLRWNREKREEGNR